MYLLNGNIYIMSRNKQSNFSCIGASNHSAFEREANDYYSTDESAVTLLHNHGLLDKDLPYFETAVGGGRLAKELKRLGYNVTKEIDLFDRGYPSERKDFFQVKEVFQGNTIINPPYSFINEWIQHTLDITSNKAYIFCRIQTIETLKRYEIFKEKPPLYICPFVKRVNCYKNDNYGAKQSAVCYSWFIWDNTVDNSETRVKWLI